MGQDLLDLQYSVQYIQCVHYSMSTNQLSQRVGPMEVKIWIPRKLDQTGLSSTPVRLMVNFFLGHLKCTLCSVSIQVTVYKPVFQTCVRTWHLPDVESGPAEH